MKQFIAITCCLLLTAFISCENCNTCATMCSCEGRTDISNKVVETIMARRSIRNYKQIPVSRDTIHQILLCGINAPNGQNKQSWEVRVVDNEVVMKAIMNALDEGGKGDLSSCFRGAPVMAFIARDLSYDFSAYDCGLLAQNMMLSATSMGVGSICLGSPVRFILDSPNRDKILSMLGFSEGYELSLCVGFGYANETPEAKPRNVDKVRFVD